MHEYARRQTARNDRASDPAVTWMSAVSPRSPVSHSIRARYLTPACSGRAKLEVRTKPRG
jgi:hypothetical protein